MIKITKNIEKINQKAGTNYERKQKIIQIFKNNI